MIRVGVIGACGRMGTMASRAVIDDPELALVAAVSPSCAGEDLAVAIGHPKAEGKVSAQLEALVQADTEIAVDFTRPDVVMDDVRFGCTHGIHMVVGTTGVGLDEQETIREWLKDSDANVVVAPNFSIGAVVAQRLAEEAARHFPAAEIIELHHDQKIDAPSGTAAATARRIAAARSEAWAGPEGESVEGVRGGSVEGIPVHSVRLPGLVAHQEVLFGGPGQTLSIRHDSTDRSSFMPGVILAIKEIARRPGLTLGLEPFLGT
ncbi:MAG TPA: 4-hydroxy-tetrahydrodipicolinate reductase [Actinomycetota bacterium]|nr:4-hydroxy-tetrahydrodipicolinate reductase [Actinomycetota bacterium]